MNVIIPVRILTKYINHESEYLWNPSATKNEYLNDSKNHQDAKCKSCIATLISYGKEYYVITCYHGIQNHIKIKILARLDDEIISFKMKELYSLKQYDVSILGFCDDNKKYISKFAEYQENHQNSYKMKFKLNKKYDNLTINYLSHQDKKNKSNDIRDNLYNKKITCNYIGYNLSKIRSELYPPIPVLNVKINNASNNINHEGLSGSLVTKNNIIYGMISFYNIENKTFSVIPSYCLQLFLVMSLNNNTIKSYCFSTNVCDFAENKIGHIITKNYNISYKTDTDQYIIFRKDDIIETINDIPFDDDGNLFFEKMKINVPLDTYFVLENSKYHKFKYYKKDGTDKYIPVEKSICPVQLNEYIKFDLDYHHKVIKYQGLIITEMSEQLLSYYNNLRIEISGKVLYHYNYCYSKTKQKIIVIINVQYDKLPNNLSEIYKRIELPLINEGNIYYIPIISKINGKKINNLDELENIISENKSSLSILLETVHKKYITLNYKNNNLFIS